MIACDLPTLAERRDIAKLYLGRIHLQDDPAVHLDYLAAMSAKMRSVPGAHCL
jgi:hypothetical protein